MLYFLVLENHSNKSNDFLYENKLFNIVQDYYQTNPINDNELEDKYKKLMIRALKEMDAPEEQLERLNLK